MKNFKFYLLTFFVTLGVSFSSCSSDDDSSSSQDEETFIRYSIDGTNYEYLNIASAESNNFTINGQLGLDEGDDFSFVSIWFPLTYTTGTYEFSGDFFEEGDYKLNLESEPLTVDGWATSGSVTITSIDSEFIEGTFSGTITDDTNSVTIENGTFKAYTIE